MMEIELKPNKRNREWIVWIHVYYPESCMTFCGTQVTKKREINI